MKKSKNIFLLIAAILLFAILFNLISPVSKQEIIEIAKSKTCSIRFLLKYQQDDFESCLAIIEKHHFKNLSLDDKKDIAINFILYSDLQGGRASVFIEMISPYKNDLIKSMENITDLELKHQYQISDKAINEYRQKIKSFKYFLTESDTHQ